MKPALEIDSLTVKYSGYTHPAVEDVSFSVKENTITALIGPNGSGKTTLIKSVLGLLEHEGEIKIFGKPVNEVYEQIGFVPQRFTFDQTFPITVYEFLSLVLTNHSSRSISQKVKKALSYVSAVDISNKKLSTLSGGQLQRVLLARALVKQPKLLLLDEPESGVDVGGEQTFYDLVEKLVKEKKVTAIIASHELDVVYAYAEKVICLNCRTVCIGKPQDVLKQETFEELYGRGLKYYGHPRKRHKHKGVKHD